MAKLPTELRLAVVDGDVLRYRCGFAVEYSLFHVPGLDAPIRGKKELRAYLDTVAYTEADCKEEKVVESSQNAIEIAKGYLSQIERVCGCKTKVILSGKTNFREDVATIRPYKGNRPDRKPAAYSDLTSWFMDNGAIVTDGIEADDLLAIEADEDVIICSVDKDLDQVPGWHYNFVDDKLYYITEEEGWYNLCKQILMGDTTDNIVGIPKVGEKKAAAILQGLETREDMWRAVVSAYEGHFGAGYKPVLNETAILVYMLRYPEDYWEDPILPEDYLGEE